MPLCSTLRYGLSGPLAGTDLFYPSFGHWIAQWVAAPGIDPTSLLPATAEMVDNAAMAETRALRKPIVTVHEHGFFVLAFVVFVHVVGVIVTEVRDGGGLISAMFSGRKVLSDEPADATKPPMSGPE